jgi:NADPH-dependent glutamate synthase beta subunit-like oxidoreductase
VAGADLTVQAVQDGKTAAGAIAAYLNDLGS